jgi:hypothetical protein
MRLVKLVLMLGLISVAGTAIGAVGVEAAPSDVGSSGAVREKSSTREELKAKLAAAKSEAAKKGQRQSLKPLKRDVREKKTAAAQATERANEARAAVIQATAIHLEKQNAKEAASKSFELTRANHEKKQRDLEAAGKALAAARVAKDRAEASAAVVRKNLETAQADVIKAQQEDAAAAAEADEANSSVEE